MPFSLNVALSISLWVGGVILLWFTRPGKASPRRGRSQPHQRGGRWEERPTPVPVRWWLGMALMGAGTISFMGGITTRYMPYLIWSSVIAVFLVSIYYAIQLQMTSRRAHPLLAFGIGTLIINGLFWGISLIALPFFLPIFWGIGVLGLIIWLLTRPQWRERLLRAGLLLIVLAGMLTLIVETHTIRSNLQYLNEVLLANYNESFQDVQTKNQRYSIALEQAQGCQSIVQQKYPTTEDNGGTPYVDLLEHDLTDAQQASDKAQTLVQIVPGLLPTYTSYTQEAENQFHNYMQTLADARFQSERALRDLGRVCDRTRELTDSWSRTILWIEPGDYWSSEENDYPSGRACYYGELYTADHVTYKVVDGKVTDEQEHIEETIIDDSDGSDIEGTSWKMFLPADYYYMVEQRWITPIPRNNPTDDEIIDYLCGTNGILQEGTTFVKVAGSQVVEMEDQEDLYVGDTRYGAWCKQNPDGTVSTYLETETLPPDVEWCWYQPQGQSTDYYYTRTGSGGHFVYIRGPRRCIYCVPQRSWSGGEIVPDTTLSRINQTDASGYRKPSDMGGGPDSGK